VVFHTFKDGADVIKMLIDGPAVDDDVIDVDFHERKVSEDKEHDSGELTWAVLETKGKLYELVNCPRDYTCCFRD